MKYLIVIVIIILNLLGIFTFIKHNFFTIRDKYLTVTFSNDTLIPEKISYSGIAGMRHMQILLQEIIYLGVKLNRKVILPPPWIALWKKHNNDILIDKNKKWSDYFEWTDFHQYIETKPIITFNDNYNINTNLSYKYFDPSITKPENIDDNIDLIIYSFWNNPKTGLKPYSLHKFYPKLGWNYPLIKVSSVIRQIVDKILNRLGLNMFNPYVFLHIRRGDFLHNKQLAPPVGTIAYTSPKYISEFISNKNIKDTIVISSNEKDTTYYEDLKKLLSNKLIFEDELFKNLDDTYDNYQKYEILNEIANRSKINIYTTHPKLSINHLNKMSLKK